MEADVIIVGAGPTGLMLAAELRLAGARPLVLERQQKLREIPKANGFAGQITELLRYRGLLERVLEAGIGPIHTAPRLPFGNVHLDFSGLPDPPIWGVHMPQPRLERVLDQHARQLGAVLRRGHEVIGAGQDGGTVTAEVHHRDRRYQVTARYLVACDGARSRIRELAGISFPGTTYPEVNRLGQVAIHDSVTRFENGDLDVPGLGLVRAGFTRTERGVFAYGSLVPGVLMIQTTEDESTAVDDNAAMSFAEFEESVGRVLGGHLPMGEATRLSRYGFEARQADRYRERRIFVAGDAAHQFPATGIGINFGMLDAVNLAWKLAADIHGWAPAGLLDSYGHERHFAGVRGMMQTQAQVALRRGEDAAADALRELFTELTAYQQPLRHMGELIAGVDIRYPLPSSNGHVLIGRFAPNLTLRIGEEALSLADLMHGARPVFLDLAGRSELREAAREWEPRIDIHTASASDRPADALLIRPDAHVAWAAAIDESADTALPALRAALGAWCGVPPAAR